MCGIAGLLNDRPGPIDSVLESMAESLRHRGPDDAGTWIDPSVGVGLAHRRLAILDLSPAGHQPMASASGRWILTYNGELYNHRVLRRSLEREHRIRWNGHSDSEVLLAALECWGVEATLARSNGMFAFGAWDREKHCLILARDRMGEKPLYVGWIAGCISFASELRALRKIPGWEGGIESEALHFFLRYGYVPTPYSIHPHVFQLPPGTWLRLTLNDVRSIPDAPTFLSMAIRYWDLRRVVLQGLDKRIEGDMERAADTLESLLADSVRLRVDADVPVGTILSGGVDSSLIASLMRKATTERVRTFTIGFMEEDFNEAPYAKSVATYLGTEHTEWCLTGNDALDLVPRIAEIYDEPFADPSQLPTLLVTRMARTQVTVALSGDGGDELFFGYQRYFDVLRMWQLLGRLPAHGRTILAGALRTIGVIGGHTGFRLQRLAARIAARDFDDLFWNRSAFNPFLSAQVEENCHLPPLESLPEGGIINRMRYLDQARYLPDNILTKVDRASMTVGLELRTPFLDHRVVAFSWRIPDAWLFDGTTGKALLKKILYRHIPKHLVDRRKKGFDIPLDSWLRGPLRQWMGDLLASESLRHLPHVRGIDLERLTDEHLKGQANHGFTLWPFLMLEAWRQAHE